MTSRDFCYWLQGFFEIADAKNLTPEQVECMKKHLALVFVHEIDPSFGPPEKQKVLDALHSPGGALTPGGKPVFRC